MTMTRGALIGFLLFYAAGSALGNQTHGKSVIDGLFENYDSRIPPNFELGEPTRVTVQIYILSIDTISETNMDFSMSMFLRQSWIEPRFNYTPVAGMRTLELDTNLMKKVWVPDTYMPAEKSASVHHVTVPNKLMHIFPNGKIQYSQRISATLKCNFDLRKYPLDEQHCVVEFESYGYTKETLIFAWNDIPFVLEKNLRVPQFTLADTGTGTCDKTFVGDGYTKETLEFAWNDIPLMLEKNLRVPQFVLADTGTGTCDKTFVGVSYTCVSFMFHLQRNMGYYITQIYIPSYLIVFLSWVSFWLDIDAVPARISLGLLTVLTMTTQSSGARANLPKVSYVKAIDVWMATCLAFVFLALVQFAYVNVLARVEKRRKTKEIGKVAAGALMQSANGSPTKQSVPSMPFSPTSGTKPTFLNAAKKLSIGSKNSEEGTPTDPMNDVEKQSNDDEAKSDGEKTNFLTSLRGLKLSQILSSDREKARSVDRISRYLFPLVFLMFNIIYWSVYVFWIPHRLD